MAGFYVGIAKCGCERAWLVDGDKTTPQEIAEFARRQKSAKRHMTHAERINNTPHPDCVNHATNGLGYDTTPTPDAPEPLNDQEI